MSDEELKVQDAIVNGLIEHYQTVIERYKAENSENKIIRRTLENFMRGLWEEIQVGELEYTTSEVYEMLEREIFTDNHVAISSADMFSDLKAEISMYENSEQSIDEMIQGIKSIISIYER